MSTGCKERQGTSVSEAVSQLPLTIARIRHEQPSTTPLTQTPPRHHQYVPMSSVAVRKPDENSSSTSQLQSATAIMSTRFSQCSRGVTTSKHCATTETSPVLSQHISQCSNSIISPSCTYGPSPTSSSVSQSSVMPILSPYIPHQSSSTTPSTCTYGSSPPLSASLIRRELVDIASKCQVMANQIDLFSSSSSSYPSYPTTITSPPAEALALIEKNVQLTSEISELKTCKDEWKKRCVDLEHKLASLQYTTHRPVDNQEGIDAVIKESLRQIESLETKLTECEVERESLRRELSELHGMVSHMSAQLVTYKEDFENERRDRERAQGRIAELETQLIVAESRKPTSQLIGRGGTNHHHRNPLHSQGSIGYDMCDDIQCDAPTLSPPTPSVSTFPKSTNPVKNSCASESSDKLKCVNNQNGVIGLQDGYENRHYVINQKVSSRASKGFDETDCMITNREKSDKVQVIKTGKVTGDNPDNGICNKSDVNRVSSKCGSVVGSRNTELLPVNETLPRCGGGDPTEADSASASPLDINCKFYLGTPVEDIDQPNLRGRGLSEFNRSASIPTGRGLSELNRSESYMAPLTERSVTNNVDQKRLRKNLSDISSLRAVNEDTILCSSSQSLQSSTYGQTSGVEPAPARSRLRGISTVDGIIRTPLGADESVAGSVVIHVQPPGSSKSTGPSGEAQREGEEEPLQCPKCRKLFKVEHHYLLMNHMEDVCM